MTNSQKEFISPIDSLSYSALTQLLRNPLIFKMKYILGVYDQKMSVSGLIGKAGHLALQTYYGGNVEVDLPKDKASKIGISRDIGLKMLDEYDDSYIKFGKTGNREQLLRGYNQAMNFYFEQEPVYHKILMVEQKLTAQLKTVFGELLPLPASGIPDIVHQTKNGEVEIIDTKFVKSFTNYDTEDYIKVIQAEFLFHLYLAETGVKANRVLFREIKRTKNQPCEEAGCKEQHDKQNCHQQIRDWAVPTDHEPYHILFYNLYRDVVKYLSNDPIFLPNLSDPFDGEHAGLIYAQGLISADMSDVEVIHKVRDIALVSKQFIPSRLDRAENQTLLPEEKIKVRLAEFGIPVEPKETRVGASVTQYRFKVSAGVRMSLIKQHKDDIALALAVKGNVRIIAPIPGTSLVGIEVENPKREVIKLDKKHFEKDTLALPIGVDVHGEFIRSRLNEMPHLLVAGATGAGKSVFLNSVLTALTKQLTPDKMKLLLIDPKRVELSAFGRKPHLLMPVVYDLDEATKALSEMVKEMGNRYKLLEKAGRRDIGDYNNTRREQSKKLPYWVIVIDEFADLILGEKIGRRGKKTKASLQAVAQRVHITHQAKQHAKLGIKYKPNLDDMEVEQNAEDLIVRIAQMGRGAGIHLILATQRPSVDVVTGLIKANMPTRIAFRTASKTDSQIILDQPGAEELLGKGDMLFLDPANRGLQRVQALLS